MKPTIQEQGTLHARKVSRIGRDATRILQIASAGS